MKPGPRFPASMAQGVLPDKQPGRHRWTAAAMYVLTSHQASAAAAGSQVTLGIDNLLSVLVGCIDCEQPYDAAKGTRCEAEPYDWYGTGDGTRDPA